MASDDSKLFSNFLHSYSIEIPPTSSATDLVETVESVFHLLDESLLRDICSAALSHRDLHSKDNKISDLGCWGRIIDSVRLITAQRREIAASNFRQVIAIGSSGDKGRLDLFLNQLFRKHQIDYLFLTILDEAIAACSKSKDMEDNFYMLTYVLKTLDALKASEPKAAVVVEKVSAVDENVRHPPHLAKADHASSANGNEDLETERQNKLIIAGSYISDLIKESKGDVRQLKDRLIADLDRDAIDKVSFATALQDNIDACTAAGYVNKGKLLQFIKDTVAAEEARMKIQPIPDTDENPTSHFDELSTHHAPKFVGEKSGKGGLSSTVLSPSTFIDASNVSILEKVKNNKKKKEKKAVKLKVLSLADKVAEQLSSHGWASIDNFIPLDVVRRVRIEAGLFKEHYEQSEIWVGKQADVGAHLSVPSVRGDKVLWLCGGHNSAAPEGVSRTVKATNEIEPCKLEVKAVAPIRRFNALKELIASSDKLLNELKTKVPCLSGIYERSDAMLANYPGNGSRFARHVDNTTLDGRRLTVLIYLNPGWTREQGGALRLTKLRDDESGVTRAETGEGQTRMKKSATEEEDDSSTAAVDIYPESGRLAMFLSAEMPHEVMPTFGDRHAITLWYYDKDERASAILKAKEAGKAAATAKTTVESQVEARKFISELLDGSSGQSTSAGEDLEAQELVKLRTKVQRMSDEAVGIVSSITGAPSISSFREGFQLLVKEDLQQMRSLFRNMGLS